MNELQNHVDMLFQNQRETMEVRDLKEEILSNMLAKRDDFLSQGIDEVTATQKAKESLISIDGLLEGSQLTHVSHYHMECLQTTLLNCTLFWIFTLPLLFTRFSLFSFFGLLATIVFGITYVIKSKQQSDTIAFVSISAIGKFKKRVWIVWGLFFLVSICIMAAVTLASDIWFGRPLDISGPYQFANVAMRFYVPLLTIVIPITIGSFPKILIKNEKRCNDE